MMTILVAGVLLWSLVHFGRRLTPGLRATLEDRMGPGSRGVVAALLVLAVVLMVLGYRAADDVPVYAPPVWGVHVNNTLMLAAIFLFGLGSSKSSLRSRLRHPMLLGFALWAALHLLVNGDLASLVLFGGLLVWALAEIVVINRAVPDYVPRTGGTGAGTVRLAVITVVLYAVITGVHAALGVWPFPGGMA